MTTLTLSTFTRYSYRQISRSPDSLSLHPEKRVCRTLFTLLLSTMSRKINTHPSEAGNILVGRK